MTVRSLLWIGPARGLPAEVAEDPRIDVLWEDRCPQRAPRCDLVVLDARCEGAEAWLAERKPGDAPVVVWGPRPDPGWLTRGARAVLPASSEPPGPAERLLALLARPSGQPSRNDAATRFVARSPAMRRVAELAQRAGRSRATVLVLGETGTGKEVIARSVHDASPRAGRPFVAINCAALPDALLESELFGHARGAFTGADRERRGAFEEAHSGTLFLDEVGETSGAFQAKLLRVLQDRAVRPLGGTRSRDVDVRIVAATHRNLQHEVARGRFREDLFFRLHVFPIHLTPLRERPEDVLPLAEHFLALHGRAEGRAGSSLSSAARRRLLAHRWPGNVRELENQIQRALVLAEPEETLTEAHFDGMISVEAPPPELADLDLPEDEPLADTLARIEAWLLRGALDRHAGHRTATARTLGLTREGLYKKMKRHGIG